MSRWQRGDDGAEDDTQQQYDGDDGKNDLRFALLAIVLHRFAPEIKLVIGDW
jgi:hypothetical protein